MRADQARDFIGKGHPGGRSARWLADPGSEVVGLLSGLSLANHSDPGSFLVVQASSTQPRRIPVRRLLGGRMDWHLALTFPRLFQLVVACQFRASYQDLRS